MTLFIVFRWPMQHVSPLDPNLKENESAFRENFFQDLYALH
jgi:hypothetical protein